MIDTLPDKLSDLLELALADLKKQESAPDSFICMAQWLTEYNGKCGTCLAGAVMRFSLGICVKNTHVGPYMTGISPDTRKKLFALNYLRKGYPMSAMMVIDKDNAAAIQTAANLARQVVPYKDNPQEWWHTMGLLLADLKRGNL